MRWRILLLVLCVGCASRSVDDYQSEGEAIQRSLVKELKKVQSVEQLRERAPRLRHHFNDLVELMIEARKNIRGEAVVHDSRWSDALRGEMIRLYELEGAREVMESAEREALTKLDRFEEKKAH